MALLIGGNFLANIVEKWVDPSAEKHGDVWDAIDTFFNVMFAIELLWNMYLGSPMDMLEECEQSLAR